MDVYYKFVLEVIIVNLEEIIEWETIFVWNGGVDQIWWWFNFRYGEFFDLYKWVRSLIVVICWARFNF
jgi:hypothetical protein